MALKAIHTSKGTWKMGRRRPVARAPRLSLKNYLRATLPPAPASCDYSGPAMEALQNIYLNNELGDCVIAGGYHVIGVETGNANGGTPFIATSQQITADYSAIGGYNPNDPSTDQGCDETTALDYWSQTGFADHSKLLGYLAVDPTNQAELMSALYLFENLYFGLELPDKYVNPAPSASGFTWDTAGPPDPNNGHCIVGVGYNAHGVQIDTWGMIGTFTWAAIAKYCTTSANGALYVLLSQDELTQGQTRAPNGVDWTALVADFDSIGGNVPSPVPPSPTPPVGPAASVTLAQAQQWAAAGFAGSRSTLTQHQAIALAQKGLSANWPKAKS
jgi:hypothetical protein